MNGPGHEQDEHILEVWSDSFKEGEWLFGHVLRPFYKEIRVDYLHGFQPSFKLVGKNGEVFNAIVYGDYKSWEPVPDQIKDQLEYGKPDVLLYDPKANRILLGIEETAAVPTGNQSLQRLERVWYAANAGIPFVYLVSEFGLHRDGHVRRSSIWPSYLALMLSSQYKTPSVTMLYGSHEKPEDYSVGRGVEMLGKLTHLVVQGWLGDNIMESKASVLKDAYKEMCRFILSQYKEISPYLPGTQHLASDEFVDFLAERVMNG